MDWKDSLQQFLDTNPDLPQGSDPQVPGPKAPSLPRLEIILDRKGRKGKDATIISGFNADDDEVARIASTLKSKLATGGSARGGEILLQGDRRREVTDILRTLGYKTTTR